MNDFDLVVIGGGVTGAAVLREAVRCGLSALLVEQRDYAWGTSSRSTKLAHGGLRYLDTGDLRLVRDSIRERDRLIREGIAQPLPFVLVAESLRLKNVLGVGAYSLLSTRRPAVPRTPAQVAAQVPALRPGLVGSAYEEAAIDDARLVLRLLHEARVHGAQTRNGTRVERLVREDGQVTGVELIDVETQAHSTVRARAVVNATGVWADEVRAAPSAQLRPLRGSHLLFSAHRLPLAQAVSFKHPRDGRFVCAVPWEDVVVVGTTDIDHRGGLRDEPRVSESELEYLLEAAQHAFAPLGLGHADIVSCFAGVRPVIDDGSGTPSQASREHVVRVDDGLVTVTGGKLTTCRQMAHDALRLLRERLPALATLEPDGPFLDPPSGGLQRLTARYGPAAGAVAELGTEPVGETQTLWGEVRWALRHEQVRHLDDLLLRRVRIGLMLPEGARAELPRVRAICQAELGWDDARWAAEERRYLELWACNHAPPRPAAEVHAS